MKTTGIFCRSGCASRPPLRANVAFYDTTSLAEGAGFRPCKRCAPTAHSVIAHYQEVVEAACRAIESSEQPPSLADLAVASGFSPFHFHRIFKLVTGTTPHA